MPASTNLIAAGFNTLFVGQVAQSGSYPGIFLGGEAAATKGDSAGSGMYKLHGPKSFPVQVPARERSFSVDDHGVAASHSYGPASLASGDMGLLIQDQTLETIIYNYTAVAIGDLQLIAGSPDVAPQKLLFLLHRKGEDPVTGAVVWDNLIVYAEVGSRGKDFQARGSDSNYLYDITHFPIKRFPWGEAVSGQFTQFTRLGYLPIHSDNPLMLHGFLSDNTETDIVLDYEPVSDTKTLLWTDASKETLSTGYTVNTSTKTVSYAAAAADDAYGVVAYEVAEEDL